MRNSIICIIISVFLLTVMLPIKSIEAQVESDVEKWAVVIGVADYAYGDDEDDLLYPDDDAEDLAACLEPLFGEDHVKLLVDSDATEDNIENAISDWLDSNEDENDVVLFFFSGHGYMGGICPHDMSPYVGGVEAKTLDSWFNKLESEHIIIILDTCQAADSLSVLPQTGRIIMSCNEISKVCWTGGWLFHGVFSYHVIKAFNNPELADANNDQSVSASEIFDYVREEVISHTSDPSNRVPEVQRPLMLDQHEGDLILFTFTEVTFDIDPRVGWLYVDEKRYKADSLPVSFTWNLGEFHSLRVPTKVLGEQDEALAFVAWSDGNTEDNREIIVEKYCSYIASFSSGNPLTVISEFGEVEGERTWANNSMATFSVPDVVDHQDGSRHVFTSWCGDSTATTPEASILMDSPKLVSASWELQYQLILISEYGTPETKEWYPADSVATYSALDTVDHQDGTRHVFVGWNADSESPVPEGSITMDSPKTINAIWQPQYKLTIEGLPIDATVDGEGWYNAGNTASTGEALQLIEEDSGVRHVFKTWQVDGIAKEGNPLSLVMDSPHVLTIEYDTKYYLSLESSHGDPQGSGWYTAESEVPISIESSQGTIIKQAFDSWSEGAEVTEANTTILMDGPKTITANWKSDYSLLYTLIGVVLACCVAIGILTVIVRKRKLQTSKVTGG